MKLTKHIHKDYTVWKNEDEDLHREDGPAVIYNDGIEQWWLNGEPFNTEEDYKKELYRRNLKTLNNSI